MAVRRLFVANRGEIALRVLRTARRLGIETVLGVSAADRDGLPAATADRAVVLGPAAAARSYLDVGLVLHAARATGCDALHPGYGFLSERPELAEGCEVAGIAFVGPRAETIRALGDKLSARALAAEAGVPTVPGTDRAGTAEEVAGAAAGIGFPVVLKASAGGGGKGMVQVRSAAELPAAFARAAREAEAAFGDGRLYVERLVERARHVEVQILGDGEGGVVHLGDRDCSVQRRYQKLIEEAPASMPPALATEMREAAMRLCARARYRGAGTVEFLHDVERSAVHFIEVNSRIQVEHPVTEEITGQDVVALQLAAATGEGIPPQETIRFHGHAVEARINAEDPARGFAPSPGRVARWEPPEGEGLRLDSHVRAGDAVPPFYDSMLGKLVAHGPDRAAAVGRLAAAARRFRIEGVATTLPLAARILDHPDFRADRIHTRWLEETALPAMLEPQE